MCGGDRPSSYRAQLAARQGSLGVALELLDGVVGTDRDQTAARSLRAAIRRRLGRRADALDDIQAVLAVDPLDAMAWDQRRWLAIDEGHSPSAGGGSEVPTGPAIGGPVPGGPVPGGQTGLDVAHDYAAAGLLEEAIDLLRRNLTAGSGAPYAMVGYTLAWLLSLAGDPEAAAELRRAAETPPDYGFPARLEEVDVLESAMAGRPEDARAPYYYGNLLYDRRRYEDAVDAWRRSARLDPSFPTAHRNLGLAEFNVLGRPEEALACYQRAFAAGPTDARVLYELDQLRRRCGAAPAERTALLEECRALVDKRDDLTIEYVTLLNILGRYDEALNVMRSRRFHPWEGGEGLVSAQWVWANLRLGTLALYAADPGTAIAFIEAALTRPTNLGEGQAPPGTRKRSPVPSRARLARRRTGERGAVTGWSWRRPFKAPHGNWGANPPIGRPRPNVPLDTRTPQPKSWGTCSAAARQRAAEPQRIDYFATSLPTFLVFEDDLDQRNRAECRYIEALALVGLGRLPAARRHLLQVLDIDASHAGAAWHLWRLGLDHGQDQRPPCQTS